MEIVKTGLDNFPIKGGLGFFSIHRIRVHPLSKERAGDSQPIILGRGKTGVALP